VLGGSSRRVWNKRQYVSCIRRSENSKPSSPSQPPATTPATPLCLVNDSRGCTPLSSHRPHDSSCNDRPTRCYFNVRSNADMGLISLIYRTEPKIKKLENRKLKKRMLRSVGKQSGESVESVVKTIDFRNFFVNRGTRLLQCQISPSSVQKC